MKLYILILLVLVNAVNLKAQAQSDTRFQTFLDNFYSKPAHVQNQTFLSFETGFSQPSIIGLNPNTTFIHTYNLDLRYGFIRINEKTGIPNVFKHQSEFTYVSNISADFKKLNISSNGLYSDGWRFGFGLQDGFGYDFINNKKLYLNHLSSISWLRVDVGGSPDDSSDSLYIKRFDEKFKFGSTYSGGIRYQLYSIFNLEIGYEHAIYFSDFDFAPWFGSWMVDLVLQRSPELYEPDLIKYFHSYYPLVKFVYKNFISYVLSEFRRTNQYFPFKSEKSFNYDCFKVGISLVI